MANNKFDSVLHYIRRIAGTPAADALTDRQLLQSFAARHDEAAFTTLLQRHAALVWGVCVRVLGQAQDAEDAFQATFLVLARKAGRVRWHQDVGNWLYAVALRTSLKAKAGVARRHRQERQMHDMPAGESACDAGWSEIRPVLDEELSRLPYKYRAPVVLHYLVGKTYAQAAQVLGWPEGTVSTRLTRAREMLRARLARRGLALSTGLLGTLFSQEAAPAALLQSTVKAAVLVTAGKALAAGLVSVRVATLTEGVLKAMFLTKLKIAAGLLLVVGLAGAGTGAVLQRTQAGRTEVPGAAKAAAQAPAAEPPKEDPLWQEMKRLKEENDRLHRELGDLREKVEAIEQQLAALDKRTAKKELTYKGKTKNQWIEQLRDLDPAARKPAIQALVFRQSSIDR